MKKSTHGWPMFGYDGSTAFIEVVKPTMALSVIDLGFSMPGDLAVLPLRYAAWIVAIGDGQFLHPTESTNAAVVRARERLSQQVSA